MNLGAGERLESGHAKLLGQGVNSCVFQQLVAAVVDRGDRGVGFEDSLAGELLGEVFTSVEVLEETADSAKVKVCELNLAWLCDWC